MFVPQGVEDKYAAEKVLPRMIWEVYVLRLICFEKKIKLGILTLESKQPDA